MSCVFCNNLLPANWCVQSESHCLAYQLKEGVYVVVVKVRAGREGAPIPSLYYVQGEVNGPSSREYFLFDNVKIKRQNTGCGRTNGPQVRDIIKENGNFITTKS